MKYGKFIKQYKGKDFSKVPLSRRTDFGWTLGVKLDGNYVQVHKQGKVIWFFTSGGKEFYIKELAEELLHVPYDFIIEAEFNNVSNGRHLGDRNQASTGHFRSEFSKGILCSAPLSSLGIFDILGIDKFDLISTEVRRGDRVLFLQTLEMYMGNRVELIKFIDVTMEQAITYSRAVIENGGEGVFLFHNKHIIHDKGRSNLAIKIKGDKSTVMKVVGFVPSKTVEGENGSLLMEDTDGRLQPFSGLSQKLRRGSNIELLGKKFVVNYESINKDGVYILGFINEKGIIE